MAGSAPGRSDHGSDGQGWWRQAACADSDPELFFPLTAFGPSQAQEATAKAVCAHCPVTVPCLDWALRTGQQAGIWGGLSEAERTGKYLQPDRG